MLSKKETDTFTGADEVRWVIGGQDYFRLLESIISRAQHTLSVFVYIIAPDATGSRILEKLIAAARRGVSVTLLVDDFASDELDPGLDAEMKNAGIRFHRFEPLFSTSNTYIGRRMHAKVVVADEQEALVGGINFADRYHGSETEPPWLDYALYLKGTPGIILEKWGQALMRPFDSVRMPMPRIKMFSHDAGYPDPSGLWLKVGVNDFIRNRKEITRSYKIAVRKAEQRITIVGGYFLPGRRFMKLLRQATERGVKVDIILTRISDVPVTRLAAEYLYGRLLRDGIRLFEYTSAMVHGKAAVVDNQWMTIGSYNQNPLSAYLSIEVNVDVVNRAVCEDFQAHLDQIISEKCEEVTLEMFSGRSGWWVKLKRWLSYRMVKLSLRLLFLANRVKTDDD